VDYVLIGLHVRWRVQSDGSPNALFLGDHYLRVQTQLHFASDDMDDASRGNIRNLKQTDKELIEREEDALHRFLALGALGEIKGAAT
tara:strand:+ start:356 stop:616 length:261 start_codon:yes stop_codon:yes gene_type:complete